MHRLRAILERFKAEIKAHPMIAIGLVLTLILVYFAWRNASGSGSSGTTDTSGTGLWDPTQGGGGGGGGGVPPGPGPGPGPIINPPPGDGGSSLIPPGGGDGSGGGGGIVPNGQRVAEDIRSGWGTPSLIPGTFARTLAPSGLIPGTFTRTLQPFGAFGANPFNAINAAAVSKQSGRTVASQRAHRGLTDTQTMPHPTLRIWSGSGARRARNVD